MSVDGKERERVEKDNCCESFSVIVLSIKYRALL